MLKQVIVVRSDLDLPRGKLAAQVAHASLEAALRSDALEDWREAGQKKIVVQAELDHLHDVHEHAQRQGLVTALIRDTGHTVVTSGTVTALGIGPADDAKIDKVTGGLDTL